MDPHSGHDTDKMHRRLAELEAREADRVQAEQDLMESQARLNKAEEVAHLGSWEMDLSTGKSIWSDEFFRICGLKPGAIKPSAEEGFKLIHPEDRERAAAAVQRSTESGEKYDIEKRIVRPDGSIRYVQSIGEVLFDDGGKPQRLMGSFLDITDRKKNELERERLIEELQTALAKVRRLTGLLPICASCKQIRDDKGYWHDVTVYVKNHSDASFSHGLCPDCAKKLYPELFDRTAE